MGLDCPTLVSFGVEAGKTYSQELTTGGYTLGLPEDAGKEGLGKCKLTAFEVKQYRTLRYGSFPPPAHRS
jgi:hypothetical protein